MMITKLAVDRERIEPVSPRNLVPAIPSSWLIILNPSAGCHRTHQVQSLCHRLEQELEAEVRITYSYAQIAGLLSAHHSRPGVAVFGGDGTLAEVVNHMDLAAQSLLVLPGGTGNGLARDLGLTSVERALAARRANTRRVVDLLQVTLHTPHAQIRRLVVSTAALGYTAETVVRSRQLPRRLGAWRYILASLIQAAAMPTRRMRVAVDGHPAREMQLTNLVVNNTRHVGNFSGFRRARLGDGRSDVLLADSRLWSQLLQNLGLLTRTYLWSPGVELQARALHVRAMAPLRLMLDGEIWNDVWEVSLAVLPGKLYCYHWPGAGRP